MILEIRDCLHELASDDKRKCNRGPFTTDGQVGDWGFGTAYCKDFTPRIRNSSPWPCEMLHCPCELNLKRNPECES